MLDFNRKIYKDLDNWIKSDLRRPLLIRGARQVGKSYAVETWAKKHFGPAQYVKLNLEKDIAARELFTGNMDVPEILQNIQLLKGIYLGKPKSILFIDEIQFEPRALTALRYFYEELPELPVIAAGSLIEFVLKEVGIPVGRVQSLHMHPMNFVEFLEALDRRELAQFISTHNFSEPIAESIHTTLQNLLRTYFFVGGFPEAVKVYVKSKDFSRVSEVHRVIAQGYEDDFPKYARKADWEALSTIFQKIPFTLHQQRVKYVDLDRTLRGEKIKKALELLCQAGIVTKVISSQAKKLPLKSKLDYKFFKLLFIDIGLLHHTMGFDWSQILPSSDITDVAKGVLAEQFVGQEILSKNTSSSEQNLYYWYRAEKSSNAEVDYLVDHKGKLLPIEVKSGTRAKLKSLLLCLEKMNLEKGYVFSQRNIQTSKELIFLPLYLAGAL